MDLTVKELIENNLDIIHDDKLFWYASKVIIEDYKISILIN